ncbi:MAG: ZIP family metal transporter [Candidatus Firestonebacteria bacterium]|nr:ZIP family metal transporter [Candidatus Firestonebacteria bacterium]
MKLYYYIFISISVISCISLVGVLSFFLSKKKLENTLVFLVSFSAGSLLGDCFIHILPEIIKINGFNTWPIVSVLGGILVFFILEKFIYWRHCHIPTSEEHPHPIVFMNIVGDSLHNFIDGMAIAGSYLLNPSLGITTTIAVIFHEIPQEIGDFGVLLFGGFTRAKALLQNFISSISAFFGAFLVLLIKDSYQNFLPLLMSFTAGNFIYIAGVDLLPELKKETELYKSFIQLIGFILGMGVMFLLIYIE